MIKPNEFFSLLSDETRLRCLLLIQSEKELCVCELGQILGSIQPKISRHLALLRQAGIVVDERRGQWVYYKINPNLIEWARQILKTTLNELKGTKLFSSDLEKLATFRKDNPCK